MPAAFRVFATCPPSHGTPAGYTSLVQQIAKWSEAAGCEGTLVYTDNGLLDPWLVSQLVVQATERLCPLVAVQPAYMHPYSVAKMVATFANLHGRRLWLNLVAGGFRNDLLALGDESDHDRRYDRLIEYTSIVLGLVRGEAVTMDGEFYQVKNLRLTPAVPRDLCPGMTISGSSNAGLDAARRLGAVAIQYPRPPLELEKEAAPADVERGIRIGIISRADPDHAWEVARTRFPEDRKGQVTHQMAMKVSDSVWHQQLSALGRTSAEEANPYWLVPFENYQTFCPYLVGGYERVAAEVARYLALGYRTVILDVPASPEELKHIGIVFERARALLAA